MFFYICIDWVENKLNYNTFVSKATEQFIIDDDIKQHLKYFCLRCYRSSKFRWNNFQKLITVIRIH